MKIYYNNKTVEQYCTDYKSAIKYFRDARVVKKLAELMTDLRFFGSILDFKDVPKLQRYRLHDLIGNKQGIKSLSVDYTWRMEIRVEFYAETVDGEDVITILEVSRHYAK